MDTSNTYNLASNDTLSINELLVILKTQVTEKMEISFDNKRESDNKSIYLNNDRILKDNPDFKFTSIEDGVLKTYTSIKERLKQ